MEVSTATRPELTVVNEKVISRAWADSRYHPMWYAGSAILFAISLTSDLLSRPMVPALDSSSDMMRMIAIAIVSVVLTATFTATYQREHLKFQRGEKPRLRGMFNTMGSEWSLSILGIVLYIPHLVIWLFFRTAFPVNAGSFNEWAILAQIGVSCLLLPFAFAGLFVVDQGCSPFEALKRSWRFTMKAPKSILWTLALSYLLGSLGVFACAFGYIFTSTIFYLSPTILYEDNLRAGVIP